MSAPAELEAVLAGLPLELDRRRPIRPQIYRCLRDAIVTTRLLPGQAMSKNELSQWMGVSRTPVQEVLLRLEGEGLVDIFPQNGTYVARMKVADIEESLFLRAALEPEIVARLCAVADAAAIARLEAIVEAQHAAMASRSLDRLWQTDADFHKDICELAGLPGLWRTIHAARNHLARIRYLSVEQLDGAAAAMAQHARITACIAAGDTENAAAAMRAHTRHNLRHMQSLMDAHPDYFETKAS